MNENDLALTWEHQVRFAGKVFAMKLIAVSHGVSNPAHRHFGLHSLGPDVGHDLGSSLAGDCVSHPKHSSRVSFADKPFEASKVDHAAVFPKAGRDELRREMHFGAQSSAWLCRRAADA